MSSALQARSRQTEQRMLAAAERLLTRKGTAEFSLADIAQEAGVSVGGLYRRFPDKQALLVAVQLRIYEMMDREYTLVEQAALRCEAALEPRLRALVAGIAALLKRHARQIKAIVEASWLYRDVAKYGVVEFNAHRARFKAVLIRHAAEIRHDDPERALEFCYGCVYEMIASHFGFGRRVATEHSGWNVLLQDLQRLCHAYLTTPGSKPASKGAPRKAKLK